MQNTCITLCLVQQVTNIAVFVNDKLLKIHQAMDLFAMINVVETIAFPSTTVLIPLNVNDDLF